MNCKTCGCSILDHIPEPSAGCIKCAHNPDIKNPCQEFIEQKTIKGVVIKKANVIAEDNRRKIVSILNGEIGVRDIHILFMKKGEQVLGQHYHTFSEVCYIFKGKAQYKLKNRLTNEEMEVEVNEGDIMFRDAFVTHNCVASEDCIMIDGASDTWINADWNLYPEKLI